MLTRKQSNLLILAQIEAKIKSNPELRFHQILQNLKIVELDKEVQIGKFPNEVEYLSSDKFHEESSETYGRIVENK